MQRSSIPAIVLRMIEQLESRTYQSVSTTTSVTTSAKSALLGQSYSITAKVKPASGTAVAKGTIELLDNGKDTGLTGTLNHKGYYVFNVTPGNSLYVGKYKFSIRYLGTSAFVGSKSKAIAFAVKGPGLATAADGLEVGMVTAGTGAAAATGESVTLKYTGFYTSGEVFDQSNSHSPADISFILNANPEAVITGFDEGTTGMKVGETRVLVIPSALGYKDGQTRVFVIQLLAINAG